MTEMHIWAERSFITTDHDGGGTAQEIKRLVKGTDFDHTTWGWVKTFIEVFYDKSFWALDAWIVKQGIVEECDPVYSFHQIEFSQLKDLRDTLSRVISDPTQAESLFPSSTGMPNQHGKSYMNSVVNLYQALTQIFNKIPDDPEDSPWTFYYSTS